MDPRNGTGHRNIKNTINSSSTALGHPNYKSSLFLCAHENKGNALGVLCPKHGGGVGEGCVWHGQHQPARYYSQPPNSVAKGVPPRKRAISAKALLRKTTDEIVMGSPLTIHVPHSVEALLNSHHVQHYSASRLASYEVLLLSASNVTLA